MGIQLITGYIMNPQKELHLRQYGLIMKLAATELRNRK
ncbi:hypothetical protein NC99_36940 [Sunxiuqinia dokdonensis]|uniref:Uncharacterized protein n=1 Tax=Sunxiuqinia dokdonensis TaxID=1409788 RepID=A0A0L8V4W5_9BACT|nr:hypothetical protein NC99_36940 [Sunxiuqinia dokdonensis]